MVKPKSLSKKSGTSSRRIPASPRKRKPKPVSARLPEAEKRILNAARKEFIAKGLEGARMQSVASAAGVNKALLHYYFRSKEKLYQKVLEDTLGTVWGAIRAEFRAQDPSLGLEPLLRTVITAYVRVLAANPEFPLFVFREMANGDRAFAEGLPSLMRDFQDVPATLIKALQAETAAGKVKPIPPVHFFMNMMGMTVATFLIMPMIRRIGPSFGIRIDFDQAFVEQRIESIADTLLNGIRIKR
jgi:TetR/AcrR family transcriptional regulator